MPKYKVSTLYSRTELGSDISGTQCLNTAPFCAGARVLVLGHQVWTQPNKLLKFGANQVSFDWDTAIKNFKINKWPSGRLFWQRPSGHT